MMAHLRHHMTAVGLTMIDDLDEALLFSDNGLRPERFV
jgi:hypothetical protein